ncbi:class I SAM-dependent methyltransferase [Lachnospiraceae bacterium MD1]|uniref:Class I SAM-dependent methyltransferase n=1 Tax=Variimorphobacter saccharofermentans TaxID=2755051 RepID=A0A839K1F9_9FIRM|nr:class I SAM-dependent methyltransferase [Variimorphobacter saccharofermentans]
MINVKEYDNEKAFWNQQYNECIPVDLRRLTLTVEPTFDACLGIFGEKTKRVCDFGCGTGDILFQYAQYYPDHCGVGIDESETGISFANQTAKLSNYHNYRFMVGNIDTLSEFQDGEFDGIILSNVLDVMPEKISNETVKELNRILKDHGYWFIKVNPFYSSEEINELNYKEIGMHMYVENGVLRLRQESLLYWIDYVHHLGRVERILEFEYPWQEGLNRLFLVRKERRQIGADAFPEYH